jgi:Tfp pilus assembly protein PilE
MRWPRVRFTVRRLMIVVAIVAISLGVFETVRAWEKYSERAARESLITRLYLSEFNERIEMARRQKKGREARISQGFPFEDEIINEKLEKASVLGAELSRRRLEFHAELKEKYDRATRYPWLPVAPDPPEPE